MEGVVESVRRWTAVMSSTQQAWSEVLRRKREWLSKADFARVHALAEVEQRLNTQLEQLIQQRKSLLIQFGQHGVKATTLRVAIQQLEPVPSDLAEQLSDLECRMVETQRDAWIVWILANRCASYYREVAELMATGGKVSPTYDEREPATIEAECLLLDAAA